ncbi:hypothetical protein Vadar_030468 [Vaccinium darrowii]|uniref:Uncharacterized protein n=1 Tax=Vaccinium darrowii TaxID=229202 RepID=A0ACB7ZG44_9ERIC|nr:hypothetical protein Vadar_030468 [Vaccinium darrowii]
MRMLKTPTIQAWHLEKAIPVAADGGGARVPPEEGGGSGAKVSTFTTSFIPCEQWPGKPHMYQCSPSVFSAITSAPELKVTAPVGATHC